jgi:hypothetical protein
MAIRFIDITVTHPARALVAGTLVFAALTASADEPVKPINKTLTVQQQRMKDCSVQAKEKSGAERQTFMKACLGAKAAEASPKTPQQRMTSCNAEAKAKALKGDARKQFMSSCLKG